jgi:hypothetical protein
MPVTNKISKADFKFTLRLRPDSGRLFYLKRFGSRRLGLAIRANLAGGYGCANTYFEDPDGHLLEIFVW